jgi:hypothetical protein
LESGGYALPIPHDVLMTLSYCKSAANPEIAGNPLIYGFFSERKHQLRRKSVAEGKKITHRANAFPLSVCRL